MIWMKRPFSAKCQISWNQVQWEGKINSRRFLVDFARDEDESEKGVCSAETAKARESMPRNVVYRIMRDGIRKRNAAIEEEMGTKDRLL